jgi:hypothetical protein
MDKTESHKKENYCREILCNKTQSIVECESMCREIVKCINEPVVAVPKVKKERELLEGVVEYFIFWN